MRRKRRAALLALTAAGAAGLGVSMIGSYSQSVSQGYGRLRPVVVVTGGLAGGKKLTADLVRRRTELRQVPDRFVPAGSLSDPAAAVGFELAAPLVAGSYLTAGMLGSRAGNEPDRARIGRGRIPVELTVSGADALSRRGRSAKVDVLVTREGGVGGRGSTRLAAERVPLIAVGGEDPSEPGTGLDRVVLGLTRQQAIELIDAEAFARRLTVIPGGRG